ncbi:MAG TPA: sensor domain-containing diguanylate cyclase [Gammaproteobacteria bacterium]|nr:sensor domain-containing diguanylate cyclase [Gammaproteobacteria bacterium]
MRDGEASTKLSRTIAGTLTLRMVELQTNPIFHTPVEERFERITRLARRHLRVRIAGITLLDQEKEWFKSIAGWSISELSFEQSLCRRIGQNSEPCVIPDMQVDRRFKDHPLVAGKPGLRFYASYPMVDIKGAMAATFCLLDTAPRELSEEDHQAFLDFGQIAQQELLTDQRNSSVSDLISKLGSARRASMIDPLTKVWNRAGADVLLRGMLSRTEDQDVDFTVCLIDIDQFKTINDTYGHPVGDEVLRKLAARFVRVLRPDDIVCRFGGDEFLAILPGLKARDALTIVERMRSAASNEPIRTRTGSINFTVSIGYSSTTSRAKVSYGDLLREVDDALLLCKRDGRNCSRPAV